jgi:hypothetical protein
MKLAALFLSSAAAALLLAALASFSPALAGGSDEGPDAHQDDGPSFFGFVRDTSGKAIADAKVTAEIKGRGAVIARTNSTGVYLIPGFGKEISLIISPAWRLTTVAPRILSLPSRTWILTKPSSSPSQIAR